MIKRTLWFFVFALMAISCLDQPDCFSLNNNIVGIGFKKLSNKTSDTLTLRSVIAAGTDSIFLTDMRITGKNLPLNIYGDSTTFYFEGLDKVYDLTLKYSSKSQFVSEDCGGRFVITGLQAFSKTFDSVRVAASTPKSRDIAGTNIEVFRCPNTSRIKLRFVSAVTISSIEANYPGTILLPTTAVTTLLLPLNTTESTSSIKFTIGGVTKTLVLNYERKFDTLFHACGEQVVISELVIADHNFSKATVVRKAIQDPNQTNLEITL
jgi:hypothetical protein